MTTQTYIDTEVKKIINSSDYEFPKNLAMASAWVLANFKGINLKIFHTKNSSLCDYNILATSENETQGRAMAQAVEEKLKQLGNAKVYSLEGLQEASWILLDLGDIIVHIFQESVRDAYDLDELFKESAQIKIPEEYYFGPETQVPKKEDPLSNYF